MARPADDDFVVKVVPLAMKLSLPVVTKGSGSTASKHGHDHLALAFYKVAISTTYGLNIALGIYLIAFFAGIDKPWVRRAVMPLVFVTLAVSFVTFILGVLLD